MFIKFFTNKVENYFLNFEKTNIFNGITKESQIFIIIMRNIASHAIANNNTNELYNIILLLYRKCIYKKIIIFSNTLLLI